MFPSDSYQLSLYLLDFIGSTFGSHNICETVLNSTLKDRIHRVGLNPTLPGQGQKMASFALMPYYSKKS